MFDYAVEMSYLSLRLNKIHQKMSDNEENLDIAKKNKTNFMDEDGICFEEIQVKEIEIEGEREREKRERDSHARTHIHKNTRTHVGT